MKVKKNAIKITDPESGETKTIDRLIPETEEETEELQKEKETGERPAPMNLATNLEDEK